MLNAIYTVWDRSKRIVLSIAIIILFTTMFASISNYTTHYNRQGIVTEKYSTCAVIEDKQGNLWEYEDARLEEGQSVTMKMFTNNTDTIIKDDVITKLIINNN